METENRPASKKCEIEVTPKMIEVGIDTLMALGTENAIDFLDIVFISMLRASKAPAPTRELP